MTVTDLIPARQQPAWARLEGYAAKAEGLWLAELFRADPARGTSLAAEACRVYPDSSKNPITDEIVAARLELARQSGLRHRGKILAPAIETELLVQAARRLDQDTSTAALIRRCRTREGAVGMSTAQTRVVIVGAGLPGSAPPKPSAGSQCRSPWLTSTTITPSSHFSTR